MAELPNTRARTLKVADIWLKTLGPGVYTGALPHSERHLKAGCTAVPPHHTIYKFCSNLFFPIPVFSLQQLANDTG